MICESQNTFFRFSNRQDLTAIITSDSQISYKDLFISAGKLASTFSDCGIDKKNYIPLLIADNLQFIKTFVALWKIGAVPVLLNPKLLDVEINSILSDFHFDFLITDKLVSIKNLKLKIINANSFIDDENKNFTDSGSNLKDEAVVIFTSGSEGKPKGVVHTFSSLINSIKSGNQILKQTDKDRWLASLPFFHIGGFQIFCRSLYYGCSIILPHSIQTKEIAQSILQNKPSHLSLVSTQLERLLEFEIVPDKNLKVSLIGGGFVDDELIFQAANKGWKPYRVYGSSETASFITAISADEIKAKPQSSGKALHNVDVKIDDSEILIKSSSLFKNYFDDEDETKSKLINGYYHSGDIGFVDDEGYLFVEARRNDLIVTGGENVNPVEVEKALLKIPFISDACVFPVQNKTWGQIVAAAITRSDESVNEKIIKEELKQRIVGYKIPKKIFFVNELPRTALGKLEREKIRKMF